MTVFRTTRIYALSQEWVGFWVWAFSVRKRAVRQDRVPVGAVPDRAAVARQRVRLEPEEIKELVEGCDLLVIPSTPDALSLQALLMTTSEIENIGEGNYRILLTIIPPKPNRAGEEMRRELQGRQIPLFTTGIRRFICYQKAALAGTPVYDAKDRRAQEAWQDYLKLGKEILP